ncbi:MAG TPA: hypothetical protein V6D22_26500 [Candidatus Obscuribacterales bacterium]
MDHQQLVDIFITGQEVTVPVEEVSRFYQCLIRTLDAMGNAVVSKPANPLALAYMLHKIAREYILRRTNYADAEQALRVSLRILAYLAADDAEIQAESYRLLAILFTLHRRFDNAQLCDAKAVALAMGLELSDDAFRKNQ